MTRTYKCIRVLQVVGAMNRTGGETWLMHILRRIDRSRFHFTFFCYTGYPGEYAPEAESLGGLRSLSIRVQGMALYRGLKFRGAQEASLQDGKVLQAP